MHENANEGMNGSLRPQCSPFPGPSGQACSRPASCRLRLPLPSALPSVLINIRTSVQTVVVGHAVEFECLALGDPKPQVTWSKVGGRLRPGIVQSGSIIRIAHVELADAGQYRCSATNAAGTTQSHVLLLVQGEGRQGPLWGPRSVAGAAGAAVSCLACFTLPFHFLRNFQFCVFKGQVS